MHGANMLFIVFLFNIHCAFCQDTTTTKYLIFSGCIGGSSIGFPMFNTDISFQNNQHIYSLRYVFAEEAIEAFAGLRPHSEPLEEICEFGFIYSIEKKWTNKFSGYIGGGISYVQGIKRGKYVYTVNGFFGDIKYYEEVQFMTPGLIMDAEIALLLSKYFNFSLNGFANLNIYKIFWGIGLGVHFILPFNKK